MLMVDVAQLMKPVSDDAPCGADLEYDEAFIELELCSQVKAEQRMGDSIIPAEEPVWRDVERKAAALFARTKDLRVAAHLVKALLHTGAFAGAAQGFDILRRLIEDHWDHLHPKLDPDDDNDPTMRFNVLSDLSDTSTMLTWVRRIPIVSVRGLGSFGLKDLALAMGELAPAEGEMVPSLALINGAFSETKTENLKPVGEAAANSAESIRRIERLLMDLSAGSSRPDLAPLRALFEQVAYAVHSRLSARGNGKGEGNGYVNNAGTPADATTAHNETAVTVPGTARERKEPGAITSREDVIAAIDKICAYYSQHEPTSPLPLLLGRCKRLVNKDFLSIIRDMAPSGLEQIETLRGPVEEENNDS